MKASRSYGQNSSRVVSSRMNEWLFAKKFRFRASAALLYALLSLWRERLREVERQRHCERRSPRPPSSEISDPALLGNLRAELFSRAPRRWRPRRKLCGNRKMCRRQLPQFVVYALAGRIQLSILGFFSDSALTVGQYRLRRSS